MVRLTASEVGTPKNLGYPATTGKVDSPDNLAQDALGNIYVVEDAPNGGSVGGDVWFIRDVNGDGVAESLDHFMSLQVNGAESTGMIFNPTKPTEFIMAVQHPTTTNTAGQQGDALWVFDLSNVVAPPCVDKDEDGVGRGDKRGVKTCDEHDSSNFIKKLQHAGKSHWDRR
jgi:secreted PhoX family phosphatase